MKILSLKDILFFTFFSFITFFVIILEKRQDIKEIFQYAPESNTRTQKEILSKRKDQLKNELDENYKCYEQKHPFFVEKVVKKNEVTKNMKDVLYNKYVPYEMNQIRISNEISTKSMLLNERKKQFISELRKNKVEDTLKVSKNISLDPSYDYLDIVKNKNKELTLKNYGFWIPQSNYTFSYPFIQAKGKGGWATDIVKGKILESRGHHTEKKEFLDNFQRKETDQELTGRRIFLMKNRFPFINYYKDNCSAETYFKEIPHIVLRYNGFQKWTS